jgi:hypothetical protein
MADWRGFLEEERRTRRWQNTGTLATTRLAAAISEKATLMMYGLAFAEGSAAVFALNALLRVQW